MIKFKVCPKCHGDLYLREDTFGKYFSCMQCGYLKDLVEPPLESSPKLDAFRGTELQGDAVRGAELEVA